MKKHMMDHSRLWDYDLLEELGKGEYGSVYKVHNKKNNRIYALKKINISSCHEKQKVQAFREIKALKLIKHPDIIEYFESFLSVDNIYIVMQYASKGDFSKIIKERRQKEKSFTQLELWQIFSTISNGLKYLHENKIVHRDLKLENIFMTESGKVKIGDLGMCKVMNSQSDLISTRVGTPLYFAPEIIQHRLYSFPVDVWALGCVFYNLTTLEHPFKEATIETLAYHVIEKDIKPIKGHYSGSLINLITDLLNKNVKKRPSIFEVNILLKQLKDNQIINKVVIFNAKKLAIMKNQLEQLEKQLKNNKQKKKERNEMEDSIQAPKVSKYNQSTPKKSETPRNPQYFYKQSRSNSFNKFSSTVNDWSKIKKKETAYCGMIKTNGFSLATSMVIPQKQQEINYFNSQFFAQKQNRKSFETYRKNFKRQHCN